MEMEVREERRKEGREEGTKGRRTVEEQRVKARVGEANDYLDGQGW